MIQYFPNNMIEMDKRIGIPSHIKLDAEKENQAFKEWCETQPLEKQTFDNYINQ